METEFFLRSVLTYILFWFFYFLYIFVFKVRNRIKIRGRENLPKRPYGVLTLSNHDSFMDSLPIRAAMMSFWDILFRQKLIPYDAPDYANFYGNKIGAFFMKSLRNIPIERKTGDKNVKNDFIKKCCGVLKNKNLHLFFEGGRTIDEIRPCVSGVAEVILSLLEENFDLIVMPIFLDGMKNIMPKEIGQKYWKIKCGNEVLMIIGKPIDFSDIIKIDTSKERKIHLIKKMVRDSVLALKP